MPGLDERHESVGARMLEAFFPETVYRPVALHVAAKRYLCFIEAQYFAGLSASLQTISQVAGRPIRSGAGAGLRTRTLLAGRGSAETF